MQQHRTALHVAASKGHVDIIDKLLAIKSEAVNIVDKVSMLVRVSGLIVLDFSQSTSQIKFQSTAVEVCASYYLVIKARHKYHSEMNYVFIQLCITKKV